MTDGASNHSFVFWDYTAIRLRARQYARHITVLPGLLPSVIIKDPLTTASETIVTDLGEPFVLFAGRHIKDKGVRDLPGALASARQECANLRLVLVGEGPETPLLKERFREFGLAEVVDFTGKVTEAELLNLMAGATCLVVASVREGYGMALVEAASRGTPSVVAGHPENASTGHIIEAVNGFVVEPTSEGLASGIKRVLQAGQLLRNTTKSWYDSRAPSMRITASTDAVIALYAAELTATRNSR